MPDIILNGEPESVSELYIADLLKKKGLADKRIVIEHNGSILKKENWENTPLNDGDKLEIISFVGGG